MQFPPCSYRAAAAGRSRKLSFGRAKVITEKYTSSAVKAALDLIYFWPFGSGVLTPGIKQLCLHAWITWIHGCCSHKRQCWRPTQSHCCPLQQWLCLLIPQNNRGKVPSHGDSPRQSAETEHRLPCCQRLCWATGQFFGWVLCSSTRLMLLLFQHSLSWSLFASQSSALAPSQCGIR